MKQKEGSDEDDDEWSCIMNTFIYTVHSYYELKNKFSNLNVFILNHI
jgi:hypothetical protein